MMINRGETGPAVLTGARRKHVAARSLGYELGAVADTQNRDILEQCKVHIGGARVTH